MTADFRGDPFGTASLRAGVLAAWADSPTRFREDANAEEDLRLGGYADTWCVELAQNAADAARRGGRPGPAPDRRWKTASCVSANTGAPLDAAGVSALAALRASAKRDDAGSVGRFGVGFAAVLALSDAPRVVTVHGGVAFSAAATADAVRELPGPAAELARRDGQLPVLRLVWPTGADEPPPPDGYATEVRLPLRPGLDPDALLAAAAAAAPDLLLALPDLVEITVGGLRFGTTMPPERPRNGSTVVEIGGPNGAARRWLLIRGTAEGAADTATEHRARHVRSFCWALPLDPDGRPAPLGDDVLHAPTTTAERLGLPARLIADVPLDPDRRRVRAGDATDAVLQRRRRCLPRPRGGRRTRRPAGARARGRVPALRARRPAAGAAARRPARRGLAARGGRRRRGPAHRDRPRPARPGAARPARRRPARPARRGRCPAGVVPRAAALLAELGVHRMGPAELADRLLGVRRPAGWWRAVYAALEPAVDTVPGLRDELRALPVPLADGRTVPGPAGVLLPLGADAGVGDLALPGLHVVDPDAVHPLLLRLGAALAEPDGLLDHRALRDAVDRSVDDADAGLDPVPLAEAVLGLVGRAGPRRRGVPRVAGGPRAHRRRRRAGPRGRADAGRRRAAPAAVRRRPARGARPRVAGAGVAAGAGRGRRARRVRGRRDRRRARRGPRPGRRRPLARTSSGADRPWLAVRDLDLVRDDAWPAALALLAGQPETRAAVLAPGSYTAWWLARHARLHGRRPGFWRLPSATGLAALYDPLPGSGADDAVLAAAGVRAALAVADRRDAADLLARLADPDRRPDAALVAAAHAALAAAVVDGRVDPGTSTRRTGCARWTGPWPTSPTPWSSTPRARRRAPGRRGGRRR